ncbi:MAG TPA: alkaline phosphatase family protein [Gallionellaceae bacterium]
MNKALLTLAIVIVGGYCLSAAHAATAAPNATKTATPVKHLIVIVGENRSFDNVFATYQPPKGQTVANLLSRGIVNKDGLPGKNFSLAEQKRAVPADEYSVELAIAGSYHMLPAPGANGTRGQAMPTRDSASPPKLANELPNGPFQISRHFPPGARAGSPVHRFFQMWQQYHAGKNDLMVWVADTEGTVSDKAPGTKPSRQGIVGMGFYNMAEGDAPYFRELAEHYALADNYHQPVMGGTGANFIAIASGDVGSYNRDGKAATPPENQIENPDPAPGTPNAYVQDGYSGGSYVNCSDLAQPGAASIRRYLSGLPYRAFNDGNCAPGVFYLVNNYEPGYRANGDRSPLGPEHYILPPQSMPTIAERLSQNGVSWKWYAGDRGNGKRGGKGYCTICDPFTFFQGVMESGLKRNLVDFGQFYGDIAAGSLPAVSFITPSDGVSGHPGYSTLTRFSDFVEGIVNHIQKNHALWKDTAIIITFDEGGGYYDSGYVQTIDFFGDGPRVPMILVSPHARPGWVDHTYYDHASILKFIEKNWRLQPLSARSRVALPNPVHGMQDPYVPQNRPAIGDLTNMLKEQ